MHAEKTSVTHQEFKEVEWIGHLAAALERVATEARLSLSSPPPNNLGIRPQLTEAIAILREHPLIKPGLRGSGIDERVLIRILNYFRAFFLRDLVANLAKLSVREGAKEAAQRLHRYLTADANGTIPAHEITVIHGLALKEPVS